MGAPKRHYSDEARAAALAVLDANGGLLARSAREAGVPRATLQTWATNRERAASPENRQQAREGAAEVYASIRDRGQRLIGGALDILTPDRLATDSRLLVAVNTITATAEDKGQRLSGQPTEILGVKGLTDDEAAEVVERFRVLSGRAAKRSA